MLYLLSDNFHADQTSLDWIPCSVLIYSGLWSYIILTHDLDSRCSKFIATIEFCADIFRYRNLYQYEICIILISF